MVNVLLMMGLVAAPTLALARDEDDRELPKTDRILKEMEKGFKELEARLKTDQAVIIQPNGKFKVTGARVVSVSVADQTMTVSLYNFVRTVSVAGAKIYGGGNVTGLGDLQVGDRLIVTGRFNENTHVITVETVNDVSWGSRQSAAVQAQIETLQRQLQQLMEQLRQLQNQVNR